MLLRFFKMSELSRVKPFKLSIGFNRLCNLIYGLQLKLQIIGALRIVKK